MSEVDEFIEEVFGNVLDLRECNRRLLEVLNVRQREQAPIIQGVGDIFLDAATEFRLAYPIYVGHLPVAEKKVKDESERNAEFRRFLEVRRSSLAIIVGVVLNNFVAMCASSRCPSPRPQAFPEPTVRTSSKISCPAGSYMQRDDGRQS